MPMTKNKIAFDARKSMFGAFSKTKLSAMGLREKEDRIEPNLPKRVKNPLKALDKIKLKTKKSVQELADEVEDDFW